MPTGIYKRTEFHRQKIKDSNAHYWLGRKKSLEFRKKISKTHKERGIKPPSRKGTKLSEKEKQRLSELWKGNKNPMKRLETRKKVSESLIRHYDIIGRKQYKRPKHNDRKYKNWRLVIFQRDDFTCQGCKRVGGYLEAHHIKSWVECPELRYDVNNGITLCRDCHLIITKK